MKIVGFRFKAKEDGPWEHIQEFDAIGDAALQVCRMQPQEELDRFLGQLLPGLLARARLEGNDVMGIAAIGDRDEIAMVHPPALGRTEHAGESERTFGRGYDARSKVVDRLRRTANELEKGDEGFILGVALAVAGKPGAFVRPGPLTAVHIVNQHLVVPKDLRDGLAALTIDIELLDVKGEA